MKTSTILLLAAAAGGGYLLLQRQKAKAAAAAAPGRTYAAESGVKLPEPAGKARVYSPQSAVVSTGTAVQYGKDGKPLAMGSISGNLFTSHRAPRGLGSLG